MAQGHAEQIAGYLKQLTDKDHADSFLIVSCGDVYVQFLPAGDSGLYCEAVSNVHLPRQRQLTASQMLKLEQWGFAIGDSDNYSCTLALTTPGSVDSIARFVDQILAEVYSVQPTEPLAFELNA